MAVKMSFQKNKGYKKSVGFCKGKNADRKQKMFWLGVDPKKAEILCLTIMSRWKELKSGGADAWDEESLNFLKKYKAKLYGKGVHKPQPKSFPKKQIETAPAPLPIPQEESHSIEPPSELTNPITLYTSIQKYIIQIKSDANIGEEWKKCLGLRLESLKDATADMLLKDLNKDTILPMVQYYQKRPKNKNTGKPISITTVETQIKTLKRLLDYLIEEEIIDPIKGLQKLFKNIKIKKSNADITKQLKGNPVFDIDDLTILYHNANPLLRVHMLFGLNMGYTQKEIATLLVGMVDLDRKVITRFREKTDFTVMSEWKLWEETYVFLNNNIKPTHPFDYKLDDDGETILYRNYFQERWLEHEEYGRDAYLELLKKKMNEENNEINPENYVFNKVLYLNENGVKIDNIASAWYRLREKIGKGLKNPHSFKSLRKTGADMIQKIAGVDISQVYLCHTPKTLAEKSYTNPHFERLAAALTIMRENLQPMFDNAPIYPRVDIY